MFLFFFFNLRVEILYLGGNQISYIPDSIGYMNSLIVLNLSENRLQTLPNSISCMTKKNKTTSFFLRFL